MCFLLLRHSELQLEEYDLYDTYAVPVNAVRVFECHRGGVFLFIIFYLALVANQSGFF